MRTVLVCGGRGYDLYYRVVAILSEYDNIRIIHGGAPGLDSLADKYAKAVGVEVKVYPADWKKYGKAAGPIRNQEMLDNEPVDEVIAFPGGKGTFDMCRRAREKGIKVTEVS
jgi:predicted Rossmann-fold nucleotide-binding protein